MTDILISAFLLSLVLLGIHSYFGIEIIKRGIIFTDLAIGQMAAVGAALSLFFFDGEYLYPLSLALALISGLIIALISKKSNSLEAFIGLLYAFGISSVFIILSKSYHGTEALQNLLAADILFTPMEDIYITAVLYFILGLIIFFLRKVTKGFYSDLLFFITFAITVTKSVKLAGVLVVFALLVSPALISTKIKMGGSLLYAWIIGIILNIISIFVSYHFDFPTGYTIVFFNSLAALLVSLFVSDKKLKPLATNKVTDEKSQ